MSRTLITGANGFTGSHLVNRLKRNNDVVSLVHNMVPGVWQEEVLEDTIVVTVDIRDEAALRRIMARYDIEKVYHTAALAKVRQAFKDPSNVFDVNVMGTQAVLEACRQTDVARVLVMNTDKVYGNGLLLNEHSEFVKFSEPYGASKICAALVVGSYIHSYGMSIVMPHSCNIYGYDPFSNRIVPNVTKACINGRNPAIFTNDLSVREYVFIDDLVDALVYLMEDTKKSWSYNIATGHVMNQKDVVLEILKSFPSLIPVYREGDIPNQIEVESLSSNKWEWRPEYSFEDGIANTVEMFSRYQNDWNILRRC